MEIRKTAEEAVGFVTSDMKTKPCPVDVLFADTVAVPPVKFRPMQHFQGQKYEHPQTVNLRRILESSELLKAVTKCIQKKADRPTQVSIARGLDK